MALFLVAVLAFFADATAKICQTDPFHGDCKQLCNPVCDFDTVSFAECQCCFLFYEQCDDDSCSCFNPIEEEKTAKKSVEEERRLSNCKVDKPFDIRLDGLTVNNLNGLGPNKSDPEKIVYSKVGKSANKRFFDLVVTGPPGYSTASPDKNGLSTKVGRINVQAKVTSTTKTVSNKFKFSFVDSETGSPVELEKFVFRFFDLDRDEKLTLHESVCIDLDQANPGGETAIPNLSFSTTEKKFKSTTNNGDVKTTYHASQTCAGASSATGSVQVTGEKVGYGCDNPTSIALKTVQCHPDCFNAKQCINPKKKPNFPIDQSKRTLNVEMNGRSSFEAYFILECLKAEGATCTRNFEFTSTYLDSSTCTTTTTTTTTTTKTTGYTYNMYNPYDYGYGCVNGPLPDTDLKLGKENLVINNLGGLGPTVGTAQEMRFKKAGTTLDGREFDFIVKTLPNQDKYHSFSPKEHNIGGAGGTGFQINMGVTAKKDKPKHIVEFEFLFEDQNGKAVEVDHFDIELLDLDRDAKLTLRESACFNLDFIDLKTTQIPGFDSTTLKEKSEPLRPGFATSQLRTTYNKDKNCEGSTQTEQGSVTVEANQVGFQCDLPLDVKTKDFKPIKCNPTCFNKKQCVPSKKQQFFGLIDKDGKTCTQGSPGCTFESGIDPLSRLVKTSYAGKSSFRVSLGIECIKPAGETCTRNFVFRSSYHNIKTCPCFEDLGPVTAFNINQNSLINNNLEFLGPTGGNPEMRFSKAATTLEGKVVDVVVKALHTQDLYHSFSPKEHNIAAGRGFQINLGVTAKTGKPQHTVEFEISFEDQAGKRVVMDAVDLYQFDLDRDAKLTLRERTCYDLDLIDIKGSDIPGFDSIAMKEKPEPLRPGFAATQLRTTYTKDKNCDGTTLTTHGSVTVEANQVGFQCDFPLNTPTKDMKPIKCNDPSCFNKKQCVPSKKQQFFGLVDKDGKTCTQGSPGCTFESGISPRSRLVKTRYVGKSSFRVSIGIECIKPDGETCTRNFVFRAAYQNAVRRCGCKNKQTRQFNLNANSLVVNNLGGQGPETSKAEELRYRNIGKTDDGRSFDLVIVADKHYKTVFAKERNGVLGELGNINVDVKVSDTNKGFDSTEFKYTFQDSITLDEVVLKDIDMTFFDFDVNKAENLHEITCMNLDQFDPVNSQLPAFSKDILVKRDLTKNCDGTPAKTGTVETAGSISLTSNGVGFLCDNPTFPDDLDDVPCDKCFNKIQCGKEKINKFFPIKRSKRVVTTHHADRSNFKLSFGINCEKTNGETCNRNFLFSGRRNNVCVCETLKDTEFNIASPSVNNLGGQGPETSKAKEIRYKHAGTSNGGRMFDLVVTIADGSVYKSVFAKERNGVSGKLGNINIDVQVTDANKGIQMTEFILTIVDSETGVQVEIDNFDFSWYDFDVNKAETLHEVVCIDHDQFDPSKSVLPVISPDIEVLRDVSKTCDGAPSTTGLIALRSHGVGFLCDNPLHSQDLADVPCEKCFNKQQCAKEKISKFFPVKRNRRYSKTHFTKSSRFKFWMGVECEKPVGETCNRNFLFSGSYKACKAQASS